jgi:hypothetical protein
MNACGGLNHSAKNSWRPSRPTKARSRGFDSRQQACRQSQWNAEGGEAPRSVSKAITGTPTGHFRTPQWPPMKAPTGASSFHLLLLRNECAKPTRHSIIQRKCIVS